MKREAILWWGVGKTVLGGATHVVASLKQYGRERVPRDGGLVMAVNHAAWIDIPVIGALCPRRIVYLAKIEAHEVPVLGPFIRAMGTLAVRRGESDREAVRLARQAVRQNEMLGMFVEGTRQRSGEPGEAKPGAAMVAIQEGVPVIPAAIYNSHNWHLGSRVPISIAWGEPMRFAEHPRNSKGYRSATEEIATEIRRLWEFLAEMHRLGRPEGTPPRRLAVPSKSE
ncbi:MAG TPA: lysophospholipid acyltransferase family protein [Gaiellaceae bacterium]|jgi:1-acyl-sn-glycerol-3-phosphate acyltransferase